MESLLEISLQLETTISAFYVLLLLQLYRIKVHQLVSYLSQYFQFVSKLALFVLEYFLCSPTQILLHNFLFITIHGNKNKNTKEKVKSGKPLEVR